MSGLPWRLLLKPEAGGDQRPTCQRIKLKRATQQVGKYVSLSSQSKHFFLKKKKQKTFYSLGPTSQLDLAQTVKVFSFCCLLRT
jgi:hypothetical protein